jgi:RNA polymerase sigma factor (sigma-70 family)
LQLAASIYREDIIDRCLIGDRRAFEELYRQYCRGMFSTCYRIINHHTEAEDVLQESFMDAFRNIASFNRESSFGAWLKQIVINKSINHLKKKRLALVDLEQAPVLNIYEEPEVSEAEVVYKVNEVKEAIQQLPDGYRTVLSLYLLEGYDHEEIAAILGVSFSTTRTQYIRAKNKLLQLLKK